jgi:selenocysteine lyase/cysteine desulfurase
VVRVGCSCYTTAEEIEALVTELRALARGVSAG